MTPGYRAKLNYLQIVMLQCYNLQIVLAIGLPTARRGPGPGNLTPAAAFLSSSLIDLAPAQPSQPSPAQPSTFVWTQSEESCRGRMWGQRSGGQEVTHPAPNTALLP